MPSSRGTRTNKHACMLIYAFACTRMSQVSGRATRSLARVSVLGRAHALPLGAAVLKEVLFQCVCVCVCSSVEQRKASRLLGCGRPLER